VKLASILGFLALALGTAVAQAQVNSDITWTFAGECTDGSKDCPAIGFEMKEGGTPATLQYKATLSPADRRITYVVPAGQQRCWAIKAISNGSTPSTPMYSDSSSVICKSAPAVPTDPKKPMPPVMTVTITITTGQ